MKQCSHALFALCFLLICNNLLSAQNSDSQPGIFSEGIVVLENGSEVNALIQVEKWQINPDKVTIKRSENADPETLTSKEIRSFTIPGKAKFIRHTVQVDTTRKKNRPLTDTIAPGFSSRDVLLQVLVDGMASLYSYRSEDLKQHFYFETPSFEISYLVYKEYMATPGRIGYNNQFREQLFRRLSCEDTRMSRLPKLEYENSDLKKYVISYNKCSGEDDVVWYDVNKPKDNINVYVSAGINSSNLTIFYSRYYGSATRELNYGSTVHPSFNAGIEWILPFLSHTWSISGGISYQTFETNTQFKREPNLGSNTSVEAEHLNFLVELRKYIPLNQKNKLFISGATGFSFNSSSVFHVEAELFKELFVSAHIYQVSAGYTWNDFLFGKISYTPPYNTFGELYILESDLSSLRFGLGITL